MFSKSCEYDLRAVIFIAQQSLLGEKPGLKTVAKEIGSPEAFTGKILQIDPKPFYKVYKRTLWRVSDIRGYDEESKTS